MMMNSAVFLDRDGVITHDPPHYAHRIDQLELIDGSATAIKMINDAGLKVIVITNQSGVAKGIYAETDIRIFNDEMVRRLKQQDAHIDAIYYCPHHPEASVSRYCIDCDCRKPKPGMLLKGAREFNIDFMTSFLIGDKWSDIEAGRRTGCRTVLVKTGHGLQEFQKKMDPVDYIAEDLLDAVQHFIVLTKI